MRRSQLAGQGIVRRLVLACACASLLLAAPPAASVSSAEARPFSWRKVMRLADGGGPRSEVLERALEAYTCAGVSWRAPLLTVIDYSLPSSARRLWVIDLHRAKVLFHELVAHGRGTGDLLAERFSNTSGSHQTSLGLYQTLATYQGEHGHSLRLRGLEPGINDRAEERAIVMHAAWYVSEDHVRRWGRLGRSQGCPALDPAIHREVIDTIEDGTALFAWYPDSGWLRSSRTQCLRSGTAEAGL